MQNQSTRFRQYSVEFEQCCKVFDISPKLDSIHSQQKISSDLVGGHYIFPNGLHFSEPTIPLEYPNMGCEIPNHGVQRTISPISTFFYNGLSGTWTKYGVRQEMHRRSTQVPGMCTLPLGTGTLATRSHVPCQLLCASVGNGMSRQQRLRRVEVQQSMEQFKQIKIIV